LVLALDGGGLRASLTGGLVVRSKTSSLLKYVREGIFEVANGPMAGHKVVCLADRSGSVNTIALLLDNRRHDCQFFFRAAVPGGSEADCERFLGLYETPDKKITVSVRGRELCVSAVGQPPFALVRTGELEFYLHGLPGYAIRFTSEVLASRVIDTAILTLPSEVLTLRKFRHDPTQLEAELKGETR
jgi:hypothetical protein